MSLLLIHGDDQTKSREELHHRLAAAKLNETNDIVVLDGKTLTFEVLIQNVESGSLFGSKSRLTVIENLHRLSSKTDLKQIIQYLNEQDPHSISVILWENHELTLSQLKALPTAQIVTAKISPLIFKLTDSFSPTSDLSHLLELFDKACQTDSAEMVLIMLARQLRLLIQSLDPKNKLPPWQKGKLSKTATAFGLPKLVSLHHDLTEMDLKNKTGQLPVNLQSELQTWLISIYK